MITIECHPGSGPIHAENEICINEGLISVDGKIAGPIFGINGHIEILRGVVVSEEPLIVRMTKPDFYEMMSKCDFDGIVLAHFDGEEMTDEEIRFRSYQKYLSGELKL